VKMKIAVLGCGAMGEAMISQALAKGVASPRDISVFDTNPHRLKELKKTYGLKASGSNSQAVKGVGLVVLAVLPQNLPSLMEELRGKLEADQLVVSIVARASLAALSGGLGHQALVRVMPNIAVRVGEAMSLWTASPQVTPAQKRRARRFLGALGKELFTPEERYLDMATALSGSGPAYVFLFLEALVDAGVHIGLPRELSQELALQTLLGSARMAQALEKHPAELRNLVTSPGGTTAEALLRLEEGGFRGLVNRAVLAAYEKIKALGKA
jgi:pyrroline-5-carboxylate reductase